MKKATAQHHRFLPFITRERYINKRKERGRETDKRTKRTARLETRRKEWRMRKKRKNKGEQNRKRVGRNAANCAGKRTTYYSR